MLLNNMADGKFYSIIRKKKANSMSFPSKQNKRCIIEQRYENTKNFRVSLMPGDPTVPLENQNFYYWPLRPLSHCDFALWSFETKPYQIWFLIPFSDRKPP